MVPTSMAYFPSWIIQLCSNCWFSWEFFVCSFSIPGGSLALFLPNPSLCLDSDSVLSLWPPELCQLFRVFVIIRKWHPFLQAHMILKQRLMNPSCHLPGHCGNHTPWLWTPLGGHTGKSVNFNDTDTDFWTSSFQKPYGWSPTFCARTQTILSFSKECISGLCRKRCDTSIQNNCVF